MPTPVIIDCDPGHDDVVAIWLAAAHPAIDLRAITTVGGNGRIEHTTFNARVALTVAGAGCGYALAGRGNALPPHIRIIGVPGLTNLSTTPGIEAEKR